MRMGVTHVANDTTLLDDGVLFELTTFLDGRTRAWGIFEDRFGRLRRRFDVDMDGRWLEGVFRLDERFVYDDGRIENRTWLVKQMSAGRFEATCDDCVGVAVGVCSRDMVQMSYAFRLKLPSRVVIVDLDDRLHNISARNAINRATVRKWGIRIGELTLFFEKQAVSAIGDRQVGSASNTSS
jgi:Protein of unknown function (DUF3833)